MANKMLIDATHPEETRVVVLRGNRVEEFDFETEHRKQIRGNIYLAKVTRVEPSLQAAFVEYGGNRHGFLAFSEIHPDYYQIPVADRQALIDADAGLGHAVSVHGMNLAVDKALKPIVLRLAAHYLTSVDEKGRALDRVAHFHLGNGAIVERLNWQGDMSANGLKQSYGMMVNYLYRLDEVEDNHEAFVRDGSIATSHAIKKLARDRGTLMRKRGG